MGLLVDGVWQDDSYDKNRIEGAGSCGPTRYRNLSRPMAVLALPAKADL